MCNTWLKSEDAFFPLYFWQKKTTSSLLRQVLQIAILSFSVLDCESKTLSSFHAREDGENHNQDTHVLFPSGHDQGLTVTYML